MDQDPRVSIAYDIDDVVLETQAPFYEYCHRVRGYPLITPPEMNVFRISTLLNVDDTVASELFEAFALTKEYSQLQAVEGAPEVIRRLSRVCRSSLVSARQHSFLDSTRANLRLWYKDIRFEKISLLGTPGPNGWLVSKGLECKSIGARIVVDDVQHNLVDVATHCPDTVCILLNRPWNQGALEHANMIRARDWYDVEDIAMNVVV